MTRRPFATAFCIVLMWASLLGQAPPAGRDALQTQLMNRLGEDIDSVLPTKSRVRTLLAGRLAAVLLETGLAKKRRRFRR